MRNSSNEGWKPDRYLLAYFRRVWRWDPERKAVLEASHQKAGSLLNRQCEKCKKNFPKRKVVADHIDPVINPRTGFVDWNTLYLRLFVPRTGLQALCTVCHRIKSNLENRIRRATREGATYEEFPPK